MTLLVLLALLSVLAVAALPAVVRRDGLGARQPPRSHLDWWETPSGSGFSR